MSIVTTIGIAGSTCSGKTTLARALKEELGSLHTTVLSTDNYYSVPDAIGEPGLGASNFDHPSAIDFALLETQFDKIRDGAPIDVPNYDFVTHARTGVTRVTPSRVLIVEGLFVLWSERLREKLTLSVFLNLETSERLRRRVKRDVAERGASKEETERYITNIGEPMYEKYVAPTLSYADLVIEGDKPLREQVSSLMAALKTTTMTARETEFL